jgi:ATPase subunit of ABC transporter with duplicated ATPase domains
MDEPTNHIDLQGKEELEASLVDQSITLLFTSHDQRFIENVATRFWWIHQGQLIELYDPKDYFLSLNPNDHSVGVSASTSASAKPILMPSVEKDEETILERIVELEALIEEDLGRKSKFQKPKLQRQWQAELMQLNERLEE